MPTLIEHLKQSENNFLLSSKLPPIEGSTDWEITILFYAAVHYVEAYFSTNNLHYQTHGSRETAIRRDPKIAKIFRDYREMYEYSRTARYDCRYFEDTAVASVQTRLNNIKNTITPLLA